MRSIVSLLCLALLAAVPTPARAAETFSDEQLDQMLAPIALYPDSLLSQVFMASTYPADVAAAAKWAKANPDEKGDEAVKKVAGETWDPSVQSLVAFPQVLAQMSEKPDWVQDVGDAFLASPNRVMDRVQFLRSKAKDAGNLKTTEQQKVVVEPAPAGATTTNVTIIKIEPAQPQVVYVPTYNPTVVYGSWWWPAYPPVYVPPPPGYAFASGIAAGIGFGIGIAITDSLWGDCNWGHGDVNINVNKYNNINVNNRLDVNNTSWQHNSANRRDVPYRDSQTRQKVGQTGPAGAADRDAFRGRDTQRAEAAQALEKRGIEAPARDSQQALQRSQEAGRDLRDNPAARQQLERPAGGARANPAVQPRDQGLSGGDHAFQGARNPGASQQAIQRGTASRPQANRGGGGGGFHGGGRRR